MALYAGLLAEAHERGLKSIDTELLDHGPWEGKAGNEQVTGLYAVVRATVVIEEIVEGEVITKTFTGIGDADPSNVGRNIRPHTVRMAETRAKARALRDAINVAEALADDESTAHEDDEGSRRPAPSRSSTPTPIRGGQRNGSGGQDPSGEQRQNQGRGGGSGAKARKSQVDLLTTLAVEWAGKDGVDRLETRIGKPLDDLTRGEADEWVARLTPEGRE